MEIAHFAETVYRGLSRYILRESLNISIMKKLTMISGFSARDVRDLSTWTFCVSQEIARSSIEESKPRRT